MLITFPLLGARYRKTKGRILTESEETMPKPIRATHIKATPNNYRFKVALGEMV